MTKGLPLPRTGQMWTKRPPAYNSRDMYWVYEFIRRLNAPFKQWPAFKAGIIDASGNILVPVKNLTPEQQKSWGHLDALSVGIKKLIMRVPGVQPKLKSIVGTMMLMKERNELSYPSEQELEQQFTQLLNTLVESEGAVNAVSAGNIQGIGVGPKGEPGAPKPLLKMLKRKKNGLPRPQNNP